MRRMHGSGRSTLDAAVAEAARLQDRIVTHDAAAAPPTPFWFLQDHFAFAEKGVPAFVRGATRVATNAASAGTANGDLAPRTCSMASALVRGDEQRQKAQGWPG